MDKKPATGTSESKSSQETESLVKRLAGPSSGKAGLAKDQSEINRIITDASKGSKFYENEKKKDKEVTARIKKILKQRDEALKEADISRIEVRVDQLITQLESQRDLSQIIVHVDMDAFYASVELLDNPSLKGKPFGVGKGVLCTASYEARKFGVRSGMAGFIAKKLCPELILLPMHFQRYSEMSDKIFDLFRRYDPDMAPAGCDEGYMNITKYCEEHCITAEECVQQMRKLIHEETKLTVSAGIAPNKMLAKICSDRNKPNGQFQLQFEPEVIRNFMHDLSIRKVPGIGRVNERLLEAIGIKTCGDIYINRAILSLMDKHFGVVFMLRTYLGIASNVVQAWQREDRKSIGAERTFSTLDSLPMILEKLEEVAEELEKDMTEDGWVGKTVTLKFKLDTYQVFTRAKSLDHWVTKKEELFAIGKELLLPELPVRIRLIGLRVTKLKDLVKEAESNSHGIKRFFESTSKDSESQYRSRKRVKLDKDMKDGAMDETMPGYHEHDETDYGYQEQEHEQEDDGRVHDENEGVVIELSDLSESVSTGRHSEGKGRPRPPHSTTNAQPSTSQVEGLGRPRRNSETVHRSTGASALTSTSASSSSNSKPKPFKPTAPPKTPSKSTTTISIANTPTATLTCPICSKTLETDNDGLNAHVDFCLSRGAILEAQVESSRVGSGPQPKGKEKEKPTFKGWAKPESLTKKELSAKGKEKKGGRTWGSAVKK